MYICKISFKGLYHERSHQVNLKFKNSSLAYLFTTIYFLNSSWNSFGVPVAQWLEHYVSSAKVVGSIPREHIY